MFTNSKQEYSAMKNKKKNYEKRSEILSKRLLSKMYALEANYMESRLSADESLDQINEQVTAWEQQLKNLSENTLKKERENLNQLYLSVISASKEERENTAAALEQYLEKINGKKKDFYTSTQRWLNDFGSWITDLEDKAKTSSGQLNRQLNNQVKYLKSQQSKLLKNYDDLQKSTGENWEKLSTGISSELNTMKASVNKVYHHFFPSGNREKKTPETKTQE